MAGLDRREAAGESTGAIARAVLCGQAMHSLSKPALHPLLTQRVEIVLQLLDRAALQQAHLKSPVSSPGHEDTVRVGVFESPLYVPWHGAGSSPHRLPARKPCCRWSRPRRPAGEINVVVLVPFAGGYQAGEDDEREFVN